VTPTDAKWALITYGADPTVSKGKTTKDHAAPHVPTIEAVLIPCWVLKHHLDLMLCTDFFFVQGYSFLHTISRNIGYCTAIPVSDCNNPTILSEMQHAICTYTLCGFCVRDIHADNAFKCVRSEILSIVMTLFEPTATLAKSSALSAPLRSVSNAVFMAFRSIASQNSWFSIWLPRPFELSIDSCWTMAFPIR
jgi:hypothetical protein